MLVLAERLVVYKIVYVGSWGEWYMLVIAIYNTQPASV